MAKQATSKVSGKRAYLGGVPYSIPAITILDADIGIDFEDAETLEYFYNIAISLPKEIAKGKFAFVAAANAGKNAPGSDTASTFVSARYGVVIDVDASADDALRAAKDCARTAVWGRYSVWFLATMAQSPVTMPPLPILPDNVDLDPELDEVMEHAAPAKPIKPAKKSVF